MSPISRKFSIEIDKLIEICNTKDFQDPNWAADKGGSPRFQAHLMSLQLMLEEQDRKLKLAIEKKIKAA